MFHNKTPKVFCSTFGVHYNFAPPSISVDSVAATAISKWTVTSASTYCPFDVSMTEFAALAIWVKFYFTNSSTFISFYLFNHFFNEGGLIDILICGATGNFIKLNLEVFYFLWHIRISVEEW